MKLDDYYRDIVGRFEEIKSLGDKSLAQLDDEGFFRRLDPESNSIAIIVRHMAGNMRSRWTDFLTSDGEKPDRHRDTEFELDDRVTADTVRAWWERGWALVFKTLHSLSVDDLDKTVTIRTKPLTVYAAIHRQLVHYAEHVGQIVFMSKHFCGDRWQTLSVPRGQSEQFNRMMRGESS